MKKLLIGTALSGALATAGIAEQSNLNMSSGDLRDDLVISTQGQQDSSTAAMVIGLMVVIVVAAALSSSGSGLGMTYGNMNASDARLKTDIRRVGTTPSGLPLYQYRYKGHPQLFEGVMAQDVERVKPEAIVWNKAGFYMVDYAQIDAELRLIH